MAVLEVWPNNRINIPHRATFSYAATHPEQARAVVENWFKRGIVVRPNLYIGSLTPASFQPIDNSEQKPDWRFGEILEAIPSEQCADVFRVVAAEGEAIVLPGNRGKRAKAIKELQDEGYQVEYVRAGGYWSRYRETVLHDPASVQLP